MTAILSTITVFAFLVVATLAQNPCCAPKQFEGLVSLHLSPNSTFREAYSRLSYDFTNQLVSSNETLIGSRQVVRQHMLVNGATRTVYIVDHHSRECRIISISSGLDQPCVPNHFRAEGTFHFGAAKDSLNFNTFRGRISTVESLISTTKATCVPISQVAFNDHFHEVQSFVNVTLGIKDRRVFNVPAECRRSGIQILRPSVQQMRASYPILKNVFLGILGY